MIAVIRQTFFVTVLSLSFSAVANLDAINEGELRIITNPPDKPIPYQTKTLILPPTSLDNGWVTNKQCLYNFSWWGDAVQIVFGKNKVRKLKITRANHIGKAWVEGNTVQLEGIGDDSELCLQSENHVFKLDQGGNTYTLIIGPFKFQLFDGFFPMKLNMRVDYPRDLLTLKKIEPASVPGIDVMTTPGHIRFEVAFEGILWITMQFTAAQSAK